MDDRARVSRALVAMEAISLPNKFVLLVLKDLLKAYGGWPFIEADNFHLLADMCFNRLEEDCRMVERGGSISQSNFMASGNAAKTPRKLEKSVNQESSTSPALKKPKVESAAEEDKLPISNVAFEADLRRRANSSKADPYSDTPVDLPLRASSEGFKLCNDDLPIVQYDPGNGGCSSSSSAVLLLDCPGSSLIKGADAASPAAAENGAPNAEDSRAQIENSGEVHFPASLELSVVPQERDVAGEEVPAALSFIAQTYSDSD